MPFPANAENVKLGKGSLLLDLLDTNGASTGLQFTGNANSIGVTPEVEKAQLFSSSQKSGALVASNRQRINYTVVAALNEYTLTNLKLFLLAEEVAANQSSGTSQSFALDNVKVGRYYEIGARRVTNVSVLKGSNPLTLNVDYELNSEFGVIRPISGAGGVVDDDDLTVNFDKPALTVTKLRIGVAGEQLARLVYLADDANSDGNAAKDRLELWRVDVAPDGELNVISEDYGQFSLSMELQADAVNHPDEPYGTLTRVIS